MAKLGVLAIASPGSRALRNAKYEKYCRLRASALPRIRAYREVGWETCDDNDAYSNACSIERRPGVKARIEYLSRQDEVLIAEKRRRIEERLWSIHEADISACFETYDVAKSDKNGELATDETGKMLTVKKQRPKLLSDLPPDLRKAIERVQIDARGNVVPQLYSKLQANQELRQMLNIGGRKEQEASDISKLSDAELIQQLADQAKELGIEIDLNFRFAQPPGVAGPPTDPASSSEYAGHSSGSGGQVVDNGNDTAVHDFPKFPPRADTSDADTGEAGSRPARKPALPTVLFKDTRPAPERPQPTKPKPS
jgi:hypothetical protein